MPAKPLNIDQYFTGNHPHTHVQRRAGTYVEAPDPNARLANCGNSCRRNECAETVTAKSNVLSFVEDLATLASNAPSQKASGPHAFPEPGSKEVPATSDGR